MTLLKLLCLFVLIVLGSSTVAKVIRNNETIPAMFFILIALSAIGFIYLQWM